VDEGAAVPQVGRRIAELRAWRGLSLQAVAEQAGFTHQYLSMIERGVRPVDKRSTLAALAAALRCSPVELGALPGAASVAVSNPHLSAALGGLDELEAALVEVEVGEVVGAARPWRDVLAEVAHLTGVLRPTADTVGVMRVLPGLIRDLNAALATAPAVRRTLLVALMGVYEAAALTSKGLRARGLPAIAVMHARRVAEELDEPAWLGLAVYLRAMTVGTSRVRSRDLALGAAADLDPHMDDLGVREVYGMLHLTAAMASAAGCDGDASRDHLAEADTAAVGVPEGTDHGFAHLLHFGPTNVAIWRTAVAVELGEHGRVAEIGRGIHPELVGSRSRQRAYWADVGRGLAMSKGSRDGAVQAFLRAEGLAGVQLTADIYVRETVTDLLPRVRRDSSAGRELRGLAYRMGIAG